MSTLVGKVVKLKRGICSMREVFLYGERMIVESEEDGIGLFTLARERDRSNIIRRVTRKDFAIVRKERRG